MCAGLGDAARIYTHVHAAGPSGIVEWHRATPPAAAPEARPAWIGHRLALRGVASPLPADHCAAVKPLMILGNVITAYT